MNPTVHHDGSPQYVADAVPTLGHSVHLRLWTDASYQPDFVVLRTVVDGEPLTVDATVERIDGDVIWWGADLPMVNPKMHYRWLLAGGAYEYLWLTAEGLFDFDVPDAGDFVLTTFPCAPAWATAAVVYQVYPDRFARSSEREQLAAIEPPEGVERPEWLIPRDWTSKPDGRSPHTPFEYFGGDLHGIESKLDYIQSLGATVLYLTPVFPAGSTHRYDASSFDRIDPLLGGDDAFASLIDACHAHGMHIVGDITLNHCGVNHEWFAQALAGQQPERDYFHFDDELDYGYACWWNVPSLPKFDHTSRLLRENLITNPGSAVRTWIEGPHALDGWRVDVANMAGRMGSVDLTHEVARDVRNTMNAISDQLLLVAEHGHDASDDLDGDGWHGTMNYAGFTRQVWCWLRSPEFNETFLGLPVEIPSLTGHQVVRSWRAFHGRIPWQQLLASWNILGSHDTARIRTVVGTADRQVAALALAVGLPGVPMVFAGDEIGATGWWGEDARVPFPWQDQDLWDHDMLDAYRALIQLRTQNVALQQGGLRWVDVADDVIAFTRDAPDHQLLFIISRSQCASSRIAQRELHWSHAEHMYGFAGEVSAGHLVVDIPHAGASIWRLS
jgi:alpha-glucosidase